MGRKKIDISPIEDERNRHVTFNKRKAGLIKKAMELSILCKCEISLIIFNQDDSLHEYNSTDPKEILSRYCKVAHISHERLTNEDYERYNKKNGKSSKKKSKNSNEENNEEEEEDFNSSSSNNTITDYQQQQQFQSIQKQLTSAPVFAKREGQDLNMSNVDYPQILPSTQIPISGIQNMTENIPEVLPFTPGTQDSIKKLFSFIGPQQNSTLPVVNPNLQNSNNFPNLTINSKRIETLNPNLSIPNNFTENPNIKKAEKRKYNSLFVSSSPTTISPLLQDPFGTDQQTMMDPQNILPSQPAKKRKKDPYNLTIQPPSIIQPKARPIANTSIILEEEKNFLSRNNDIQKNPQSSTSLPSIQTDLSLLSSPTSSSPGGTFNAQFEN